MKCAGKFSFVSPEPLPSLSPIWILSEAPLPLDLGGVKDWEKPIKAELEEWDWVISSHALGTRGIRDLEKPYVSSGF